MVGAALGGGPQVAGKGVAVAAGAPVANVCGLDGRRGGAAGGGAGR